MIEDAEKGTCTMEMLKYFVVCFVLRKYGVVGDLNCRTQAADLQKLII